MSISYEQALETLTSMFGPPWAEDSLDQVLRHFEGHMENTVESILGHGDGEPQVLLDKLENSNNAQTSEEQISMDEALARQMMQDEQARRQQAIASLPPGLRGITGTTFSATSVATNPTSSDITPVNDTKSRGTPTQLPPDFLRIPGQIGQDEALARMLQNDVFAKEVKKNPEFANNHNLFRNRNAAQGNNSGQPPNIMEALSDMGEAAKSKLSMIANRFNNKNRGQPQKVSGGLGGSSGTEERQGLLNNAASEEEISFSKPSGSNIDFEMADWNDASNAKKSS